MPLASWRDVASKRAIVEFVERVTTRGPEFVPPSDRIAVFDNDGTLWSEKPFYFQLMFTIDYVRAKAAEHPEWRKSAPFRAAMSANMLALAATGKRGLTELMTKAHAGLTTAEFARQVEDWVRDARHPRFKRPYTELVFQPMREVLTYLRSHGFKTYIVSGGGVDFLRVWAERVYGIPPEQVVGSTIEIQLETRDGEPVLVRKPELEHVNDKAGKPVGVHRQIGKRPIAAFGNSDGDLQMLQWTAAGKGARLMVLVHHTDDEREWAYDRKTPVGKLKIALEEAKRREWTVVDMRDDWRRVYSVEPGGKAGSDK